MAEAPQNNQNLSENQKEGDIADDEDEGGVSGSSGGGLTSPEGLLMLLLAGIFDTIGLIPVIGDFSDIFAGIIFGSWLFLIRNEKKATLKFIIALVLEAIPVVSDITPFVSLIAMLFGAQIPSSWIGLVYGVIKNS